MKRDYTDVFFVEKHHNAIHARLVNWAAWVKVRPHYATSPMFRAMGYRSRHAPEVRDTVNTLDALSLERVMRYLSEKHRTALKWFYVYPSIPPWKVCRFLAVNQSGLTQLVHEGRAMVLAQLNRAGVQCPCEYAM